MIRYRCYQVTTSDIVCILPSCCKTPAALQCTLIQPVFNEDTLSASAYNTLLRLVLLISSRADMTTRSTPQRCFQTEKDGYSQGLNGP